MKMIWILTLVVTASHAFAKGGIGDGGGGQVTFESNPWHLGAAPIEYCIQRAANFPQSQENLSNLVAESFRDWENFFSKHKMSGNFQTNGSPMNGTTLPSSYKEIPRCADVKSQIRFEFGTMNSELAGYRSKYPERTLGFAYQTNYDPKTLRGSGVVWIAPDNSFEEHTGAIITKFPDWTWYWSIKHQLLHEIGHVFGMPHNSTWVMNEEVMHTQLWATLRRQLSGDPKGNDMMVPLGTIESLAQVFDPLADDDYISSCSPFPTAARCANNPEIPDVVKKAFGLNGRYSLFYLKFSEVPVPNPEPANAAPAPKFKMEIKVPDRVDYKLDLRPEVLDYDPIPRLYLSGAYSLDTAWLRRVYTGSFTGTISGNGVVVPIMVNIRPQQIKISYFDSSTGRWSTMFSQSTPYVEDPTPANRR